MPNWLGDSADVFARVFSLMGICLFPLYITPTVAREWFDIWSLLSTRRTEQRHGSLPSPCMGPDDLHPALPTFRAVVQRNLDRARRRYVRACGTVTDTGEAMAEDGSITPDPSDD